MKPLTQRNRVIRIGAIAVGVLIVIALIVPFVVDVNSFRPKLESEMSAALGRQVKVGKLSLSIFSGSVSADTISIADDFAFSRNPFVTATSFKVGVRIMPLIFSKTLRITEIKLEEPQITLLRGTNGVWNFSTVGGSSQTSAEQQPAKSSETPGNSLSVDKLSVHDGRLLIGTANCAAKHKVYDKVNLVVTNFSSSTKFPFTLTASLPSGGELKLNGKCGPMNAGNVGATPFEISMAIHKLDLAASGFMAASSGTQGLANFDGVINSDGQLAKGTGNLRVDNLKLAEKGAPSKRTVAVQYGVDHNLDTDSGTLTQGDISIGKAVVHLTGSYQMQGATTSLNMKMIGSDVPLDEIAAALPAAGVVLPAGAQLQGGSLSTDLLIAGQTDKLTISGPIRMSNAKLVGFDLASKLAVVPTLSGRQPAGRDTTIRNFSVAVHMSPEGTQANALNLTIPALGEVTGAGSIGPSGALDFKMNATLSSESGIVQKAGIAGKGNSVPFAIKGTTSDPKFVPDTKAIVGNVISGKVRGEAKSTNALTGIFRKKK